MARTPQLLDRWGNPVKRAELTREVSAATMGGVRSPLTGYPSDGLNPRTLATILREADAGDPIRYLELAEAIEERDLHYAGVLGTRKRSVSQIEISVEEGGDDARSAEMAQMVRDWLKRDELAGEIFNILDAIGKGYSHTEIIWDTSEGQWKPVALRHRDPRWFRFDRHDLSTPVMLDDNGQEVTYPPYQFIFARMQAKSGLPLRSGLARLAVWNWLFKAYTQRDWAIFTQTYGQPIRLGKYGAGASEEDRNTLFRAVSNIGGDCAAIIPESMLIEFVESGNVGASTDHYERRSDWLDKQMSKAVLGQTATTDAVTGGLGSGKEHREVQEDIERADCSALSAIINRDLIQPWMSLEFGPQKTYPRIEISRPEPEDLAAFSSAIAPLIDRGLRVAAKPVLEKFGLPEPEADAEILQPATKTPPQVRSPDTDLDASAPTSVFKGGLKGLPEEKRPGAALKEEGLSAAKKQGGSPVEVLTEQMADRGAAPMRSLIDQLEAMLNASSSFDEFRVNLAAAYPEMDASSLSALLAQGMQAAFLGGMVAVTEDSDE
jgi:phage gp29-like protein